LGPSIVTSRVMSGRPSPADCTTPTGVAPSQSRR